MSVTVLMISMPSSTIGIVFTGCAPGHPAVVYLSVYQLTPILHEVLLLYLVDGFHSMPASLTELKNLLPDLDLNPGQRELSSCQPSRHCGLFNPLCHQGRAATGLM